MARGGFIPSVMGGVVRLGPSLIAAGVAQGSRLLNRRKHGTRRTKRSRSRRSRSRRTSRRYFT